MASAPDICHSISRQKPVRGKHSRCRSNNDLLYSEFIGDVTCMHWASSTAWKERIISHIYAPPDRNDSGCVCHACDCHLVDRPSSISTLHTGRLCHMLSDSFLC